ncbi:MAG TPA: enoyl-CoA hydratase/isomerase family protein [Spirochaetota bacterium]|nr:enoyl-CoA hydratase/isomerase family protein [Spirochaetota bacterium]HRZ26915.1 enoyl-CoA hydratase/isomerase family protein [Spirochaetota bacterium]HSA15993.1 enoyl-CoA hydratase/isomerase family protein [Spirochaetota bacterium]
MIWEKSPGDSGTAILYIGEVHNPLFVEEYSAAIDQILSDRNIRSLVLASRHEKIWCMGLDIQWIMEQYRTGDREAVKRFFRDGNRALFLRMLEIPLVSIAAITGHAYANGMMLALYCDYRFMRSDRGYFCLPEAGMGLADAFTPSMTKLMEKRYDPFIRDVMIPAAKKVAASELAEKKIIDLACPRREAAMESALGLAREISADRDLFERILDQRKKWSLPVIEAIEKDDENAFDHIINRFWSLMEKMGRKTS